MTHRRPLISHLRISNFRPFRGTQQIPLRPITLVYGPNSAGKTSLLRALSWIASLGSPAGIGASSSHIHRGNTADPIEFAVELPMSSAHDLIIEQPELRNAIEACITPGTSVLIEAKIGAPYIPPRLEKMPGLSHAGAPDGVCVLMSRLSVDGATVVTAEQTFDCPLASYLGEPLGHCSLRLKEVNRDHPWVSAIFDASKAAVCSQADNMLDVLESIKNKPLGNMGAFSPHLTRMQECLTRLKEAVQTFDPASLSDHLVFEAPLNPRCVPPTFLTAPEEFLRTTLTLHPDQSHEMSFPDTDRSLSEIMLGAYECNLWVLLNALAESLAVIMRHFGPLRSMPIGQFDENSITTVAPDWPSLSVKAASLANAWLKGLNREETQYELLISPRTALAEDGEAIKRTDNVWFNGVKDLRKNITLTLDQIGSGFSQVIPIVLAAFHDEEEMILIEQPELHLHPALQGDLADLFIQTSGAAGGGGATKQYILETHSEHILLRIMRRLRETAEGRLPVGMPGISPEDVAVLYVEPRGTESRIVQMPLNENGELMRDWPGGFFEEGIREVLM